MNITERISKLCLKFVMNNLEKTEGELEIIQYGIQSILINIFKFIILFSTAYFMRIFDYTLAAFISFGVLRAFASGTHANSSIKCIFINYIMFFGNVFLSLNIKLTKQFIGIIFIISLILIVLYAPADTAERPLISKKLRKELKIKSSMVVLLLAAITLVISNSIYINIITLSILQESLLITPLAYEIFRKPYKNYENVCSKY
jgi:accessory gene regulator B